MNNLGLRLGSIGLDCFAFLFLPVARGSVLLRLINIPFEQAIRYHVWLGHLTMLLFTLHGLLYVISWTIEGNLLQNVSAKGVILFLLHSHIYTYAFFFSLYIYIYTREKNATERETVIENGKMGMIRLEILFNKAKSFKTYRWGDAVQQ